MHIGFNKDKLFLRQSSYDQGQLAYRVSEDCLYENITDFEVTISAVNNDGNLHRIVIPFDGKLLTNASLSLTEEQKEMLYQALQEDEPDGITICSVNDIDSAGRMYWFMQSVAAGDHELRTPWLIIIDMDRTQLPLAQNIFTGAHKVGMHVLCLEGVNKNSLTGRKALSNPFCVQYNANLAAFATS